MQEHHWHAKTKEEIFSEILTSEHGLTIGQAERRLEKFGANEIEKSRKNPRIFILLKQFNSPLIYILLLAMIIAFIFEHFVDVYVILAVVLINAGIGFIEEKKAEKAIDALKKMIVSYAKVYRSNTWLKIPASQLTPGDIIMLEEGDKVPADARLIEEKDFRTQESSLTGESFPEDKNLKVLSERVAIADRKNMVFMSTFAVSGTAKAVVVATAEQTAIGQVAKSLQEVIQPKLHFQEKVSQLALQMAIFAILGAFLTFIIGYFFRGSEFIEIFLFTIASLVSGIPEGLPAVLIIVLAISARRMAKRNAFVRHLPSVETVGVVTVIATDKTGTLTQNSIVVEKIINSENEIDITGDGWLPIGRFMINKNPINPLVFPITEKLIHISALCNKSKLLRQDGNYEVIGDPTEAALLVLAKKAGLSREELVNNEKIIDDFPFNSDLKFRASLIKTKSTGKKQLYVVGAFEAVIHRSEHILNEGGKIKLTKNISEQFLKKAEQLSAKGFRVLALAYKDIPVTTNSVNQELVNNVVLVGLVAMKDPLRPEVKKAIEKARNAGIRIIMKTGDHKETALAIAKEIGLVGAKTKALTEEELEKMSEHEFRQAVKEVNVFARVTPKMKLKIVKTLQECGEIVAMTGDGVNDAPALKRADVGISMGIIGTDVARESSEIILADDNFASIINAVEEGRTVFRNVKRTSFFLVTTNVAEATTIIGSILVGLPLPLLPVQLLYVNLVTDTFNGIALATEPTHEDILTQPPKNKKEKILNKEIIPFLLLMVGLMVLGTLPLFYYYLQQGLDKARTIAFTAMAMFQLFNVYNMRSIKSSIFKLGVLSNKWVNYSIISSVILMLFVIYIPFFQRIFSFVPLGLSEFLLVTVVSASVLVAGEVYKMIKHKQQAK
ncbi:HAD-IC family P-type ATPase [Candidatus Pacearchaeota archaeon]|nr:hypothetical protein [uncultured archaeon]MBS3085121.1 HAD-IC family P-type ATPase [Candidatus Pacearchaeota archaeon]